MFNWLFGNTRFRIYEDSFAKTRESTLSGLKDAIENRLDVGDKFLLVAHFPDRFEEIQSNLHHWEMNYSIVDKHNSPEQLVDLFKQQNLLLTLSNRLRVEAKTNHAFTENLRVCVMGTERHPSIAYDSELEIFCRNLPCNVELGYFLSFEDAIIRNLVNETSLKILDMFGMGENELITSNMISRRLRTVLTQNAKIFTTDIAADSADEWMRLNRE